MALSKISRLVFESQDATNGGAQFFYNVNLLDLDMGGGDLVGGSNPRDAAYLVEVVSLRVGGTNTVDGAVRRLQGYGYRDGVVQLQGAPSTQENFVLGFPHNILFFVSGTDALIRLDSPVLPNGPSLIAYKTFITVHGLGWDGIINTP